MWLARSLEVPVFEQFFHIRIHTDRQTYFETKKIPRQEPFIIDSRNRKYQYNIETENISLYIKLNYIEI